MLAAGPPAALGQEPPLPGDGAGRRLGKPGLPGKGRWLPGPAVTGGSLGQEGCVPRRYSQLAAAGRACAASPRILL